MRENQREFSLYKTSIRDLSEWIVKSETFVFLKLDLGNDHTYTDQEKMKSSFYWKFRKYLTEILIPERDLFWNNSLYKSFKIDPCMVRILIRETLCSLNKGRGGCYEPERCSKELICQGPQSPFVIYCGTYLLTSYHLFIWTSKDLGWLHLRYISWNSSETIQDDPKYQHTPMRSLKASRKLALVFSP